MIGTDESIDKILLGFPKLETLVFNSVLGVNHLNIMSPKVRKLSLRSYSKTQRVPPLKVRAPWVQELEIAEVFLAPQYHLVDVSSLMNATLLNSCGSLITSNHYDNMEIACHSKWIEMVTGLFNSLCNVGELSITSELIQVFSYLKLCVEPRPLLKCTKEISMPLKKLTTVGDTIYRSV